LPGAKENRAQARQLYKEGAEAEVKALEALDPSKRRTLGITAVSTVSLMFETDEMLAAEKLAFRWLGAQSVPTFAIEQLRELLQSLWTTQSMRNAGVSFLPGQVTVSVKGGQMIVGGAPLDLIVAKVQTVQALFHRTIEHVKKLPHRKHGVPSWEACRPWLFQAPPGSYQFAVAIQESKQADFFNEVGPEPQQIADRFLSILKASSEDPQTLAAIVPEEDYWGTFLKLARNLAPTGKNFSQVEVRSAGEIKGVVLAPENRKSIGAALRPPQAQVDLPGEVREVIRGILRGVHLDRDWLEVLVDGKTEHVAGVSDAVDDVIGRW
jgi:hypothetical protein